MSASEKAKLVIDAASRAAVYIDATPDSPVTPPANIKAALSGFTSVLPNDPSEPASVLALLDELGSPATVRSTGGRYFGFVTGGTEPAAAAAAVLASAWDQNAALPVMSPVAATLDSIAARWVTELLGLPKESVATFCSGASVANMTCLIAARDALLRRMDWDVATKGLRGAPRLQVIMSDEIHASAYKALRAIGIGTDDVRFVATDDCGRMIASEVGPIDEHSLLICQAGNVNTGHCDPFAELIPQVHAANGWVHVDGAFGLWAAASPAHAHLVAGAEKADSWATDAHKWLNVSYDSGLAICARGDDLRQAMAVDAAYLDAGAERTPMHLNLQMSQRARGIEAWAAIASRGRSGIAELISSSCIHSTNMAAALAADGAEILAPVALNQVLVSFDDDVTTEAVITQTQDDRVCWAGGTTWHGRKAMRISISNSSTTKDDIDRSAAAILDAWATVSPR